MRQALNVEAGLNDGLAVPVWSKNWTDRETSHLVSVGSGS
jgi:hypothetical protein